MNPSALARSQSGFSLLESMIAGFLLVVALLSISALQATATTVEIDAHQRSQALVLVDDMVNRINANRGNVDAYVTGSDAPLGDGRPVECSGIGADLDLCEWNNLLSGSAVESEEGRPSGLKEARGCVLSSSVPGEFFVVVTWLGRVSSEPPAVRCGTADNSNHRSLVRVLRIAQLRNVTIPVATPPEAP